MQNPFISAAKRAANLANAQKSTGPRSDESKAKVANNAFKHGLAAANLFVPEALKPLYDEITESLREEINPQGILEESAFIELRNARFQMERILILQGQLAQQSADRGLDPLSDPAIEKQYDRLERYHRAAQSTFRAQMNELRRLQTERSARFEAFAQDAAIPTLANFRAIFAIGRQTTKLRQNKANQTLHDFITGPTPGEMPRN